MRKSILPRVFAVICLSIVGLVAVGCACDEDDSRPEQTCERVTAALNRASAGCNQPLADATEVCGGPCRAESLRCSERADVDACAAALEKLACFDTSARGVYARLPACVEVFEDLDSACKIEEEDDFDFDD